MQYIKHYLSPIGILEILASDKHLTHVLFRDTQKRTKPTVRRND